MACSTKLDNTKKFAETIQQEHYLVSKETWKYWTDETLHLLQKELLISIFGTKIDENKNDCPDDWMEALSNKKEELEAMNKIFEKLCEFGLDEKQAITTYTIYNVFFDTNVESKKKDEKSEEREERPYPICETPIIKFVAIKAKSIWYIDYSGRVYKTWDDYKNNNTLPKCIMVLPKDGEYQADSEKPISEDESYVWIEILPSPASKSVANGIDKLATGLSLLTIPLAFTPIGAPIVLTGLSVASASTGAWLFGRSVQRLIDRTQHKESIAPNNMENVSNWAGIAAGSMGVMVSAGTALLSNVGKTANQPGMLARAAFNTLVIGEKVCLAVVPTINGIQIYQQYTETKKIPYSDVMNFAVQVFMLTHSVINIKLANTIIISSKGKYIEDFKSELKSKTHKRAFKRAQSKARQKYPTDSRAQQNEIIKHIERVEITRNLKINSPITSTASSQSKFSLINQLRQIHIKNLLDPMKFVEILKRLSQQKKQSSTDDIPEDISNDVILECVRMLKDFCPHLPFTGYRDLIREMRGCSELSDVLKIVIKIVKQLLIISSDMKTHIFELIKFVWDYIIENLHQYALDKLEYIEDPIACEMLKGIANVLHDHLDVIGDKLLKAFKEWISSKLSTRS